MPSPSSYLIFKTSRRTSAAFIFLFMSPSEIESGGHYVAEASKVLFLLSCWKTIAEEVKGLVLMKPPGVQVLRAAGQTSKDEVFPSWGQTMIVYPNCTSPGGRASLVGGTWVFEHSCMVAGLKPCWNEELQSWCPEAAALYFLSVFLKSHNLKKSPLCS